MSKEWHIKIGVWVGVVLLLLFTLFPFYWMFVTSIKTNEEIYSSQVTLFPQSVTFKNYVTAWVNGKIGKYFKNSG